MAFSLFKYGEACDKHPPMKFRGQDSRSHIMGPVRQLTEAEKRAQRPSDDWFRHDKHLKDQVANPRADQMERGRRMNQSSVPLGGGAVPAPGVNRSIAHARLNANPDKPPLIGQIHADPTASVAPPQSAEGSRTAAVPAASSSRPTTASSQPGASPPRIHSALPSGLDGCAPMPVKDTVVQRIEAPPPPPEPVRAVSGYDALIKEQELERRVDDAVEAMKRFLQTKTFDGTPQQMSRTLQQLLKKHAPVANTTGVTNANATEMSPEVFGKALASGFNGLQLDEEVRDALFESFDADENGSVSFKECADRLCSTKSNGVVKGLRSPAARKLVAELRMKFLQRNKGESAVRAITKSFSLLNKNKDATLNKEELFNGLQRIGIRITLQEVGTLVKAFDTEGDGKVSQSEFLRAFRGRMRRRRRALVRQAYQILDTNDDQQLSLDEIAARYDASRHPAVLSGETTEEAVLTNFISSWDESGDAIVSWKEFLNYYKDISAGIDHDDYFELMMRNCWHISGGKGWAANTSNRRVLVTFDDGRQSVEEIKDDLGVGNDIGKMKERLEAQGLSGIKEIELYS